MILRLASLSLSLLALCSCEAVDGYAAAGYMQSAVSGDIALGPSSGGGASTTTDIESNLGIDEDDGSVYVRAEVDTNAGRWGVSGFSYSQTGTGVLSGTFGDIGGLGPGAVVSSELEFNNLKASWTWDLVEEGGFRFSPGLALNIFDVDTRVSSVTPVSAFEEVSVLAPVPMIYMQTEFDMGYVIANLDAGGMHIDLRDAKGTYWDIDAMLRVRPFEQFEIFGGYRYLEMDADGKTDGQDFSADIKLNGWFFGGMFNF